MKTKRLSSRIYHLGSARSMTMMELLVIVGILAVLVVAFFILFNPMQQIGKSWDSKRKKELDTLRKVLEDYYNDKNCYPKATEICYDATTNSPNPRIDSNGKQACSCHICGKQTPQKSLSPYINAIACDPQYPQKKYLYDFDCTNNGQCPQWFRIYTELSNSTDPAIAEVGCQAGCGPQTSLIYNFGYPSTNIGLENNNNLCSLKTALYVDPNCNICGTYAECKAMPYYSAGLPLYTDAGSCKIECIKD